MNKLVVTTAAAIALIAAAASLDGCKRGDDAGSANAAGQGADAAFEHYIAAYNKFLSGKPVADTDGEIDINDSSLSGGYAVWAKTSAKPTADEPARITITLFNSFDRGVEELGDGVAAAGQSSTPLDRAARDLLAKARALQAKAAEFKAYIETKKYLDDGWAKVKAEGPAFGALWRETIALNERFGAAIDDRKDAQRRADIAAARAKGDTLEASTLTALDDAKAALRLLDADPPDVAGASAKVDGVEAALVEQEAAERATKPGDDFHAQLRSNLRTLAGAFREFKAAGDAAGREKARRAMVRAYNEAVFYRNQM